MYTSSVNKKLNQLKIHNSRSTQPIFKNLVSLETEKNAASFELPQLLFSREIVLLLIFK